MRSNSLLYPLGFALLWGTSVMADPPPAPPGPGCGGSVPPPCCGSTMPSPLSLPSMQNNQLPPGMMGTQPSETPQSPATDAFAQAPPGGAESGQTALPNMIGDLGFYGLALRNVYPTVTTIPGLTAAQINQRFNLFPPFGSAAPGNPVTGPGIPAGIYIDRSTRQIYTTAQLTALMRPTTIIDPPNTTSLSNRVPITSFGAFKISEDESVRPTDRFYTSYNYYDVDGFHGNSSPINREVFGFEKTFLDGSASFGMRVPYTQVGEGLGGSSDIDGLSMIFKYALYDNRETGNIISAGFVVTVPTGPDILYAPYSTINPTLLQPYVGYVYNVGRFYLQGFSEIVVPTDSTLSTFIANDIGVGYRLNSIPVIPTFEVHVNDALNHQGALATPLGFADSVVLTGGLHTLIGKSILTLGVAAPVSGPQLYGIEAVVQFNWRY